MEIVITLAQVLIAAGILNVWLVRSGRPTPFRPEGSKNLAEEFRRYGLPDGARKLAGVAKVSLAILLLVGIWIPAVALVAAFALAALMAVAVGAHLRIRDPLYKALPATVLLGLCLFVGFAHL